MKSREKIRARLKTEAKYLCEDLETVKDHFTIRTLPVMPLVTAVVMIELIAFALAYTASFILAFTGQGYYRDFIYTPDTRA
jgi:hypothetical protein